MSKRTRVLLAMALGLIFTVLFCAIPIMQQARLASKLTRLHILANSDSSSDQQLKLKVRDRVLEEAKSASGAFAQGEITEELLGQLQHTAQNEVRANGYEYEVSVLQTRMYFDTRHYDTFSLPAGYYDAVRVVIGEGKGRNWWCVIFPPLCLGAAEGDLEAVAKEAGLSEDEVSLIQEDGTVYVMRFKLAEWWGKLTHACKE